MNLATVSLEEKVQKQIKDIVDKIASSFPADEIILFGSYAYGIPDNSSDIDLCIITSENRKRKIEIIKEIRKAIVSIIYIPVDLLIYERQDFYERASLNTTLEFKIKNEGVKLYEQ